VELIINQIDLCSNYKSIIIYKKIKRLVIATILLVVFTGISFVIDDVKAQHANSSTKTNNNTIIKHYHTFLNVTLDGKPIPVPSGIGINQSLWKDHSLDKYGMQPMNMTMEAMAPLHTMDNSGNITVDSAVNRNYTLGQFFKIWGVDFDGKKVIVTIDRKPIPDFRNYILKDDNKDHHLVIVLDGKPIPVPSGIGINQSLWKDHSLDKYGMQPMNMTMSGMSPLHTHDSSGLIHIETNTDRVYTLGQLLDIWGIDLNGKTVKMTVEEGKPVRDFRDYVLKDRGHIFLDIMS
jgi:hypothetical protein